MGKKMKNSVIFFIILLSLFMLAAANSAFCQDNERTIEDIKLEIRKTIKQEPKTQDHKDRIIQWKKRAKKIKKLLDQLLNRVERVKGGERTDKFTKKNPFEVFHNKKWKSFKFLIDYRKFLIDNIKKAERGQTGKDALAKRIIKKARYFRGESQIGDYSDLFTLFNVKDHATGLISNIENAGSVEDIGNVLKSELESSHDAFVELKTITNDLEKLESRYDGIEKYFAGGKIPPELYYPVKVVPIPEVLVNIKKAITKDITGTDFQSRMTQWKINVYNTQVCLDQLLKRVSETRDGKKSDDFPGKNPLSGISDQKQENFRFLIKYRKFLINSGKYVERHSSYSINTLKKYIDERAHQFRGEALLEKRLELNEILNIKDGCTNIINGLKTVNSSGDIVSLLKNELTGTNMAFKEYKTATNDLDELNRRFNAIKRYYDGSHKQPGYINPEKPDGYVEPAKPTPTPTNEPTDEPTDEPTPQDTPEPTPTSTGTPEPEPVSFQMSVDPVPSKVGNITKLKVSNLSGGSPPYSYTWEVNRKEVSKKSAIMLKFSKPGKYIIKVTVTDSQNNSQSQQKEFMISGDSGYNSGSGFMVLENEKTYGYSMTTEKKTKLSSN